MALAPSSDEYASGIGLGKKMKTLGMVPKGVILAMVHDVQTALPTKATAAERNWRAPPPSRWTAQICGPGQDTAQLSAAELQGCLDGEGLI